MPPICPECNNVLDSLPSRCTKCDVVVVHCSKCRGTGQEEIVSFFSPELLQDVSIPCRKCEGRGVMRDAELTR